MFCNAIYPVCFTLFGVINANFLYFVDIILHFLLFER